MIKNSRISRDITTLLILDAIRKVHATAVDHIFNHAEGSISLPMMPEIEKIAKLDSIFFGGEYMKIRVLSRVLMESMIVSF